MANKQKPNRKSESADTVRLASDSLPSTVPTESSDLHEQQIAELKDVADSLLEAVAVMQAQTARSAEIRQAIDDVRSATRAMMLPPPAPTSASEHAVTHPVPPAERDCGEGPCDCVSESCCCFDIIMTYVRVLAMQPLEIADSGANPWGELEIQMFAYLDGGIGAYIPSMFSSLSLSKLLQHPGLKVRIDRRIGTVCLRKNTTKKVDVYVDATERDAGAAERLTGGRDEEGSGSSNLILDCCCNTTPSTVFDISFTAGGQGGGAIEVEFIAVKKC